MNIPAKTASQLACGSRLLSLEDPRVVGVLNVTPDSFSDGGQFNQLDAALIRAQQMVDEGADIIDIGGESTRPGAKAVSEQQEMDRVLPVVEQISSNMDVIISLDTSTPSVMLEGAKLGAGMINDVRALQKEGALIAAAKTNLPVCLMHMQGDPVSMQDNPNYNNVTEQVVDFLSRRARACVEVGIDKERIIVDPGFGFGKAISHNLRLMKELSGVLELGFPILVGVSRKSMIGKVTGAEVDRRLPGSLALAVMAYMKGARLFRVHDVWETVQALKMAHAAQTEKEFSL